MADVPKNHCLSALPESARELFGTPISGRFPMAAASAALLKRDSRLRGRRPPAAFLKVVGAVPDRIESSRSGARGAPAFFRTLRRLFLPRKAA